MLYAQSGGDRHRRRSSSHAGCGRKAAQPLLPCIALLLSIRQESISSGTHISLSVFTLQGLGNEEDREGPTLIDFAEIASGSLPARVNNACQEQPRSPRCLLAAKCNLSRVSLDHPSSPHVLFRLQDAGLSIFIESTKQYVRVIIRCPHLDLIGVVYTDIWQGDGCHEDKRTGCARRLLCRVCPLGIMDQLMMRLIQLVRPL